MFGDVVNLVPLFFFWVKFILHLANCSKKSLPYNQGGAFPILHCNLLCIQDDGRPKVMPCRFFCTPLVWVLEFGTGSIQHSLAMEFLVRILDSHKISIM